jgi:hypothetical protein
LIIPFYVVAQLNIIAIWIIRTWRRVWRNTRRTLPTPTIWVNSNQRL